MNLTSRTYITQALLRHTGGGDVRGVPFLFLVMTDTALYELKSAPFPHNL